MKRFRLAVSLVVCVAMALVFIGCTKPPEAEKQAALAAMDAAIAAGADKFSVSDLDAAKAVLAGADTQMGEKKYKEAKASYVSAKAAFDKAAGAVEAGKKAAVAEVTAALTALEEAWKGTDAAAKAAGKKLKAQKDAFTADAVTFADGMKTAQGMIAADVLGAKAKAGELKSIIDKWDAAIKELVAPAAPAEKKK
jgi:hypothetical protein